MLPFQSDRKEGGAVSMPIESQKLETQDEVDYLEYAAQDLLQALQSRDIKGIASALRAAFELCDMMPHEEGDHL